jgi:hypothetical protein
LALLVESDKPLSMVLLPVDPTSIINDALPAFELNVRCRALEEEVVAPDNTSLDVASLASLNVKDLTVYVPAVAITMADTFVVPPMITSVVVEPNPGALLALQLEVVFQLLPPPPVQVCVAADKDPKVNRNPINTNFAYCFIGSNYPEG